MLLSKQQWREQCREYLKDSGTVMISEDEINYSYHQYLKQNKFFVKETDLVQVETQMDHQMQKVPLPFARAMMLCFGLTMAELRELYLKWKATNTMTKERAEYRVMLENAGFILLPEDHIATKMADVPATSANGAPYSPTPMLPAIIPHHVNIIQIDKPIIFDIEEPPPVIVDEGYTLGNVHPTVKVA